MNGYFGRVLRIDVTERRYWEEPLEAEVLRAFVGGSGLATYLLYRLAPAGIDPLDPANPLIFASSPLVGTKVTTTAKLAVAAKSPQTGLIGDSLSSSHFALELKKLGCDAVVITGRAELPTLLVIETDEPGVPSVTFLTASQLWGKSTTLTADEVRRSLGAQFRVAAIGPAGERLVRFATIANDGRHAGRTGTGAVMGSKRLKAIAVAGKAACPSADPVGLRRFARELARRSLGAATAKYRTLGTVANVAVFDRLGALPAYNFRQSTFERAEALSGETLQSELEHERAGCAGCSIGCEHRFVAGDVGGRLEYESLYALGPLCGIGDPAVVLRATQRCDELGLDTISTGTTIAWAMESAERGLLDSAEAGSRALRFGNGEALLEAIELIGRREGVGDLLAEGSRRAAEHVGRGSHAWAMHVKGLELPGYEPRSLKTMALGLAVGSRGACHNRSAAYEADFSERVDRLTADRRRGAIAADSEDQAALLDSLVLCKFVRRCLGDCYAESAELLRLVTGWDWSGDELRRAAERITTLKKLFNVREGWTRSDDTLPERVLGEPLPTGVAAGVTLTQAELDLMIDSYYEARGWTAAGLVPDAKVAALGLELVANVAV